MPNNSIRNHRETRNLLTRRRSEIQSQVQLKLRDGRTERAPEVGDDTEQFEADVQGELDLALLQMRAETLHLIDEALERLSSDTYGLCSACNVPIASERLRALPFAVRCRACEEQWEQEQGRMRRTPQRPDDRPFFAAERAS